jgi:energy-coupling factor transporter ATP-binding protein EcfA2
MGKKMNYTIYALRVDSKWCSKIFSSLRNGEGRFGWSYVKTADLYQLKTKIESEGWDSLSKDEKNCYQSFLLDIKACDYVIYINMPDWGKCSVARVTGSYFWRYDENEGDFNHRFPVEPNSVFVFDRNEPEIHPDLKARLKLRGRFWRIDVKDKFEALVQIQNLKPVSNIERTSQVDLAIIRIEVERLFGRYSYVLSLDELNFSPFILYGNNGSGKTTILKLLFHLLSPNKKREHYTLIAKTLFARFSVFFADEKQIIISRQEGCLSGSFTIQISQREKVISSEYIQTDNHNSVQNKPGNNFYQKLSELQLKVFSIGDNRIIESDVFEEDDNALKADSVGEETDTLFQALRKEMPNTDRDISLKRTIARFEKWMQQQAISATQSGIASVNSIYEDMTEQILNSDETEELPYSNEELLKALHYLDNQSQAFSNFGLITPPHTQKLINTLNQNAIPSITWRILKPYVDGITAQLDALQNFKDLLTKFVENINQQFFHDKKIQLHVQEGLKIVATDSSSQALDPKKLSSGEKQLLLLFCNTLMARDKATIFMIDEPEISLNIKWQRQLIRTLLNLTKNSQVQFLFATHSIELLTQYRQQVIKLSNSNQVVTE